MVAMIMAATTVATVAVTTTTKPSPGFTGAPFPL